MSQVFSLYVARQLALAILAVFAAVLALVFVIDLIELIRRAGDRSSASMATLVVLALQRTPAFGEQALPFAVLFAAIAAFLQLSRKMEFVVARAAGMSVWQLLAPALAVAALVGVLGSTLYNPVSASLREQALVREASAFGGRTAKAAPKKQWLRQRSVDGQSILRAQASSEGGLVLTDVTAFVFSPEGAFQERVDAAGARLENGVWQLQQARVLRPGAEPESHERYLLATSLTPDQVQQSMITAEAVSFWQLPEVIARAEQAGLPVSRFSLQYQSLLARPALLAAMVLIAATVSLRLFRMGGVARTIVGGVAAGFMLYVAGRLAEDLGAAGLVMPALAAWSPALVGALISVTVLLHQEDG